MSSVKWKLNGRSVSPGQLGRELGKAVESEVEKSLRNAAGGGVRLKKTSDGYVAEGSEEDIERFLRRLK